METKRKRVLLVDDEPELLEVYEGALETLDCEIVKRSSSTLASLAVLVEEFDLIVTDLKMPEMTGQELVNQIRSLDNAKKIPIIIVSGFIQDELKEQLEDTEDVQLISKPFSSNGLLELVRKLLNAPVEP